MAKEVTRKLWRRALEPLSVPHRLLAFAAVSFLGAFVLMLRYWHQGRGIGSALYLPIILVAVATGPVAGGLAGALAAALYWAALIVAHGQSDSIVLSVAGGVHLLNFVLAGATIGYFARRQRALLGESLHALDDLLVVATQALEGGTHAGIGLEQAIRELQHQGRPVALLLGHAGDDTARVASMLSRSLGPQEELVRVGDRRFCLLVSCAPAEAADLASRFESEAAANGLPLALGCAATPDDGEDLLGLVAAAAERLQARAAAAV
jgi:hypothetical protein